MLFTLIFSFQQINAQNKGNRFKMMGKGTEVIEVNQTFRSATEIFPFGKKVNNIYGIAATATVQMEQEHSHVRFILVDKNFDEYLIYEVYPLLEGDMTISIDDLCEETALLEKVQPYSVKIEIEDATVEFEKLSVTTQPEPGINFGQLRKELREQQNEDKIGRLNRNLQQKGLHWRAGKTSVSELSWSERKQLYGQSNFPPGFEYYAGGIISASSGDVSLKSAAAESPYVKSWDWRNRHGKNWISPIADQGACGSCWAFAATGATEAMTNLYFNQELQLNLSEEDVLSCSGGGTCGGGYPYRALDYIKNTGIVDEASFPYNGTDQLCENKASNPGDIIKISGRVNFGYSEYPQEEDVLKNMLIKMGPLSSGLYDWSHAIVLVGYKVVEEGDQFFYRDLNRSRYWINIQAGDPMIGKTVWIFKNSWGADFGDEGYVYVETPVTNIEWTHAIQTPIISAVNNYQVICEDRDGDGYFWWGLGEKPATCTGPDTPDGDDSDPTLGPLDEYGYCMLLNSSPVADFKSGQIIITAGDQVTFTDLSKNNPVTWEWTFEGGSPSTSAAQNPTVQYNTPGTYAVQLTVSNANGSDSKSIPSYITVKEDVPVYCSSTGSTSQEWIASVAVGAGKFVSGASSAGYQDNTNYTFQLESGSACNVQLTPGYSKKPQSEYWNIRIDYNNDADFDDPGELVFSGNPAKNTVSGTINIPSGLEVTTRMRVSMKRSSGAGACDVFSQGEVEDYSVQISKPVPQPPVADFTVSKTTVSLNEPVLFTDLSLNNPTQWQWYFPGGNPESSTQQNPVVTYATPGEYDVSLIVSKDNFTPSVKEKLNCIVAVENSTADYCTPVAVNSSLDYIQQVVIGNALNTASVGAGFLVVSHQVDLVPGQVYPVSLTPHNSSNRNYWKVWMDLNGDGDFEDAGETLLAAKNKRGTLTSDIAIPMNVTGLTRMRIAMRTESDLNPCDDNFTGEVEDYPVSFQSAALAEKSGITGSHDLGQQDKITIYPNPVKNKLYIQSGTTAAKDNPMWIALFDLNGKKLFTRQFAKSNAEIDLQSFSPGIYLIEVVRSNTVIREKIIVQ